MTQAEPNSLVLIVDDNPKNLQILGKMLTENGLSAVAAQNGQQALEYAGENLPEIILLDIMMPGMDGIEVCKHLKEDEKTKPIPVIFITALSDVNDKMRAFEAGGADYITKPFVQEEVLARLNIHLENSRLLNSLSESNRHLRELNDLKNSFLGIAAHDIRSPLGSVVGIVELMLAGDFGEMTEEQREFISLIHNAGKQILNLVSDLLDVSIIESGNLKLSPEKQQIKPLLEERLKLHQISSNKKGIQLKTRLDEIPEFYFDQERIGQVVDNLLSNAIKFSPEGAEIEVNLSHSEGKVIVFVKDNGPGIPEADQAQLFGMYRKLSAKPTAGEKSSGLGLAITKKIIDAHEGEIEVESHSGKGTLFKVVLPLKN